MSKTRMLRRNFPLLLHRRRTSMRSRSRRTISFWPTQLRIQESSFGMSMTSNRGRKSMCIPAASGRSPSLLTANVSPPRARTALWQSPQPPNRPSWTGIGSPSAPSGIPVSIHRPGRFTQHRRCLENLKWFIGSPDSRRTRSRTGLNGSAE
jgi:hypothetical protein